MLYETLLFTGALGFLALVSLGSLHGARGMGRHGGHAAHAGHRGGAGHRGHGAAANLGRFAKMRLFLSISPVDIFAVCLGTGATGLLLPKSLSGNVVLILAIVVGLAFDLALLKPIFNFALQFASKPSEGLEGTVAKTATAVSKFDSEGRGLVKIILDAEEKQLLAILPEDEKGEPIQKGDELLITGIDPAKNTCHVSRI